VPDDYQHLTSRQQLTTFFYNRVQAVGQSAQHSANK